MPGLAARAPALGLILILMYWAQSNVQLGSLERTDTMHATLVIVQLILLLTYVYSVDFLPDFPGDTTVLTAQSVIFLLMGVISYVAWRRAVNGRRLVADEIGDEDRGLHRFDRLRGGLDGGVAVADLLDPRLATFELLSRDEVMQELGCVWLSRIDLDETVV